MPKLAQRNADCVGCVSTMFGNMYMEWTDSFYKAPQRNMIFAFDGAESITYMNGTALFNETVFDMIVIRFKEDLDDLGTVTILKTDKDFPFNEKEIATVDFDFYFPAYTIGLRGQYGGPCIETEWSLDPPGYGRYNTTTVFVSPWGECKPQDPF